jgi:protein-disulfide isomerase
VFAREAFPALKENYIDTGQVRFVYRHMPLTSIHPAAQKAAEAAECAGRQGEFWAMTEELFATQSSWGQEGADAVGAFKDLARELGLDGDRFDACLDGGEAELAVQADVMAAKAANVQSTPNFFVNDLMLRGAPPQETFGQIIDYALQGKGQPEPLPMAAPWRVQGTSTARVTLIEFTDYTCAECAQHAQDTLPQIREQYVDPGQVTYVVRYLVSGDASELAAEAAECAGAQDLFWEMHNRLFQTQTEWQGASDPKTLFAGYAADLGAEQGAFETCQDEATYAENVSDDEVAAIVFGVPGAPTYFINGRGYRGTAPFDQFKQVLDQFLGQ